MNFHQLKQWLQNNLWFGENYGIHKRRFENFVQTGKTFTLVSPPTGRIWGIDISHWNKPPLNLKRMKELYGLSFVIIKGHDGTIKSNYFEQHVEAARTAGLPWLIYTWLYPGAKVSIDAQTTAWANQYKAYTDCKGVFIDAEWTSYGGQAANPNAADLRAAHDKFRTKTGKSAGTYTAKGYADQHLKGFVWKTSEPLWVAHYGVNNPALPAGATTYQFWQFTSTLDGKLLDPNGNAELDGNVFNGTAEQFAAQFGTIPTPPTGETMEKYKIVGPNGLNLRNAPVSGGVLVLVATNSTVWGTKRSDGWIHGTHYQKVGDVYATALDFYCSGSGTYVSQLPFSAPVTAPPADNGEVITKLNTALSELSDIKSELSVLANGINTLLGAVGAFPRIETMLGSIKDDTTALLAGTPPPPPANDLLDYTGSYVGEYEVIDDGSAVKWIGVNDSYDRDTTQMNRDTAQWLMDNRPADWDWFTNKVSPAVITKNEDGLYFIKLRVYRGQKIRIAEINASKNTGRMIGFSISDNQPTTICVHTPQFNDWLFAHVQGQPIYYPYIQPWRTPKDTVPNALWIPMSWLRKVS